MKRLLLVANVAKEHVLKFHRPTIDELVRRGWTVDVACAGEEDIPGCDRQFRMEWKRSPISGKTIGGLRDLRKIIDEGDYSIVYCHTPMGGLASRLASIRARKRGTRVIYCVHGFHFFKGAPIKNWLIYYPAERFLAFFTDGIITINREDYERALDRFSKGRNIYLIPGMGADFSRIHIIDSVEARRKIRKELDIPYDAPVMIYTAELTENKNQKMLINVLKELRQRGEDAYLILAGPDQEDGRLEKYAEESGMADQCRILGWRDDIGELLEASDIYTASSIREGMTINIIEARYAGLPIVATDNRGHRMAMEGCKKGSLIAINDCKAMADMVEEMIDGAGATDKEVKDPDATDIKIYDANAIASQIADILEEEMKKQS